MFATINVCLLHTCGCSLERSLLNEGCCTGGDGMTGHGCGGDDSLQSRTREIRGVTFLGQLPEQRFLCLQEAAGKGGVAWQPCRRSSMTGSAFPVGREPKPRPQWLQRANGTQHSASPCSCLVRIVPVIVFLETHQPRGSDW